jgi:1-acyl-sn-glycerol-3-phosphate acyltransferase
MNLIPSIIFSIFINLWGAIIPILYFPVFITGSSKLADKGAKAWSVGAIWALKKLCRIDFEVLGKENLPQGPFIVACKHQSMWETIIMHLIFHRPAYCFKKELIHVPFYGWFLRKMTGVQVDRKGGASALKSLVKQAKRYLSEGHVVILFPQGTRVPVGGELEKYPYQAGITALYLSCNVPVVPAALNSGLFWPKHQAKKNPGKITLKFLEPINPGLPKKEFLEKLQIATEAESKRLCEL